MHRYHRLGNIPPKRHTTLKREDGRLHYEELIGNRGFSGPSSLLYHLHMPTSISSSELVKEVKPEASLAEDDYFVHPGHIVPVVYEQGVHVCPYCQAQSALRPCPTCGR